MLEKFQKLFQANSGFQMTQDFKDAVDSVELTNENLFITGKAGTGKSTLIEYIRNHTKKKIVVLAPTGLSAINVRGQTIHSFFHLPPRLITRDSLKKPYNDRIYKDVDTYSWDTQFFTRKKLYDFFDAQLSYYYYESEANRAMAGLFEYPENELVFDEFMKAMKRLKISEELADRRLKIASQENDWRLHFVKVKPLKCKDFDNSPSIPHELQYLSS